MSTLATHAVPIPRPCLTGGGGIVVELLLGLGTGVAAILAALGWRVPDREEPGGARPHHDRDEHTREADADRAPRGAYVPEDGGRA